MSNQIGNWKLIATIIDDERLKLWEPVFPGGVVPIVDPIARKVDVPGHQNVNAYFLDLDALNVEQREGVIGIISKRFNISADEVRVELHLGVPILAEGVKVTVFDMDYFSAANLDELHGDEWDLDEDLFHHQEFEED